MTQEQTKALEDARVLVKQNCGQAAMLNAREIQTILKGLLGIIEAQISVPAPEVPGPMPEAPVVSRDVAPAGKRRGK